ncbi:hypothetical protein AgCh_022060 [Apium graveolens]
MTANGVIRKELSEKKVKNLKPFQQLKVNTAMRTHFKKPTSSLLVRCPKWRKQNFALDKGLPIKPIQKIVEVDKVKIKKWLANRIYKVKIKNRRVFVINVDGEEKPFHYDSSACITHMIRRVISVYDESCMENKFKIFDMAKYLVKKYQAKIDKMVYKKEMAERQLKFEIKVNGRVTTKIRLKFVKDYPPLTLKIVADALTDSILIEEIMERQEILEAIDEIEKEEEKRKMAEYEKCKKNHREVIPVEKSELVKLIENSEKNLVEKSEKNQVEKSQTSRMPEYSVGCSFKNSRSKDIRKVNEVLIREVQE